MAKVSGHHKQGPAKHGRLRKITVERAGNGFMIHKHHDPPEDGEGMYRGSSQEAPAVFTKHAPAHKHIKSLMAEMHPPETSTEDMQGYEPESQQA